MKRRATAMGTVGANGTAEVEGEPAEGCGVFPLLVDERTAAEMLSVSPSTLTKWRLSTPQRGPNVVRMEGRAVRYRLADLLAYVNANITAAEVEGGNS